MQLETTRFGTLEINDNDVITFTQPILGFQDYRRFVILPGPPDGAVVWLQSTESPELAFLLMDPRQVVKDYTLDLRNHELSELAVSKVDELEIYTLLVVPTDRTQVRTNLRAPVLISRKHRLGKQTILERSDYPIRFLLSEMESGSSDSKEVANAGSDS